MLFADCFYRQQRERNSVTPLGIELLTHDNHMPGRINYPGSHALAPCRSEKETQSRGTGLGTVPVHWKRPPLAVIQLLYA